MYQSGGRSVWPREECHSLGFHELTCHCPYSPPPTVAWVCETILYTLIPLLPFLPHKTLHHFTFLHMHTPTDQPHPPHTPTDRPHPPAPPTSPTHLACFCTCPLTTYSYRPAPPTTYSYRPAPPTTYSYRPASPTSPTHLACFCTCPLTTYSY